LIVDDRCIDPWMIRCRIVDASIDEPIIYQDIVDSSTFVF